MKLQEKLKFAKENVKSQLQEQLDRDFVQIGDYEWFQCIPIEGEDTYVTLKLTAKKKFDADEAVEEWEFSKENGLGAK